MPALSPRKNVFSFNFSKPLRSITLCRIVCSVESNKSMCAVEVLRAVQFFNSSKFGALIPVHSVNVLKCTVNSNKTADPVSSSKLVHPVNFGKFVCPFDVRTVNSNKPLSPVNSCKPVCLVDVYNLILPVSSNKIVHTVKSNKPAYSEISRLVNSGKPVPSGNTGKSVRPVNVCKPDCLVDICKPFLVDYWKYVVFILIFFSACKF